MKPTPRVLACLMFGLLVAADAPVPPGAYSADFSKTEVGKSPDDMMILDGTFAVKEFEGKKCLELAGDPIGSFGALFGPDGASTMEVKARIWAAASGKRFPEIGVGAGDAGGYKLFLLPGRHVVELRKGDEAIATAPCDWTSESWSDFRLRVSADGKNGANVQGKVWPHGRDEPAAWTVSAHDADAPPAGKASIWGNDFSEQPIRFADLGMNPIK